MVVLFKITMCLEKVIKYNNIPILKEKIKYINFFLLAFFLIFGKIYFFLIQIHK